MQQIYQNASVLRFNSVVLDAIYDDMSQQARLGPNPSAGSPSGARMPFQRELRLEGVSFSYPDTLLPSHTGTTISVSDDER